jgi:hypothetical protein
VVALRGVIATGAAVAIAVMSGALDRAHAGAPDIPSFLLFAGTDLWRYGSFGYGGLLWSAAGLDKSGFAFKLLVSGGGYTFLSGDQGEGIDGTMKASMEQCCPPARCRAGDLPMAISPSVCSPARWSRITGWCRSIPQATCRASISAANSLRRLVPTHSRDLGDAQRRNRIDRADRVAPHRL